MIAVRSQAPVIPVGIVGAHEVPDSRFCLPFRKLSVCIGEPFLIPPFSFENRQKRREALRGAMSHIAELLPEQHRGIYASRRI